MIKVLLPLLCTLFGIYTSAQTTTRVTLTVLNEQKAPLENVTVELLRSKDSTLVKSALTDKTGRAELENIKADTFFARISALNYSTHLTSAFTVSGQQPLISLPAITLNQAEVKQLQVVTVTAKKPFIQKLHDRIVVNVENSVISAGLANYLRGLPSNAIERIDIITNPSAKYDAAGNSGIIDIHMKKHA